jgi:hypothetical protein
MLLVHLFEEVFHKVLRQELWMDEVAIATPLARALMVLPALRLSKVCHRGILDHNLIHVVEFPIESFEAILSLLLSGELDIHISHHVFSDIVRDDKVQDLSVVAELSEYFFIEIFEMHCGLDKLLRRDLEPISESDCSPMILIELKEEESLAQWWLIVLPGAAISMSASPNLVVERTVDFVILCPILFR